MSYEEMNEYAENIDVNKFLTTGHYDSWRDIIYGVRSENKPECNTLPIANNFAKRCGRDNDLPSG